MRSKTRVQLVRLAIVVATLVVATVAANAVLFRYTTATTGGATQAVILRTVAPPATPEPSSPPAAAPDPVTVRATQTSTTRAAQRATQPRRAPRRAVARRQTPERTLPTAPTQPPGIAVGPSPSAQPSTPVAVNTGDERPPDRGQRGSGDHGASVRGKDTLGN